MEILKRDNRLVTLAEFATAVGVTDRSARRAAARGRIAVYDASGAPAAPWSRLRFVRLGEAIGQFRMIRHRTDDDALLKLAASEGPARDQAQALIGAREKKMAAEAELLEMRLAQRRGELIKKAAATAAMESIGRAVQRARKSISGWAEELCAAAQTGGLAAVSSILKAKSAELGHSVADLVDAEAAASGIGNEPK